MRVTLTGNVRVKGDCGHEIAIPVGRINSEDDLVCSECGAVDRLNPEQVADIQQKLRDAAASAGAEEVRKKLGQALEGMARKSGGRIKYTPGRS